MSFACRPLLGDTTPPGLVLPVPGVSVSHEVLFPDTAFASVTYQPNGSVDITEGGFTTTNAYQWYLPVGGNPGSSYWIRMTGLEGPTPNGPALGVWTSLSAPVTWSLSRSAVGSSISDFFVRHATSAAGANETAENLFSQLNVQVTV